ncbi:MAG: response regulator [Gemmatimonadaceae bacterium]
MNPEEALVRRRSPCVVLVAEDHDDTRTAQRIVLEAFGFVVKEARTGLDALAMAQASRPRIVLLDLVLPEIDGRQLARMLRADPTTRDAALIAISACTNPDARREALTAGCDAFVAKPVPPLLLVRTVRRHIRREVD